MTVTYADALVNELDERVEYLSWHELDTDGADA
jgi:hypothetical protein